MSIRADYQPPRPPYPVQEKGFVSYVLGQPGSVLQGLDPDRLTALITEVFAQIRGRPAWVYDPDPPIGEALFRAREDLLHRIRGGPLLPDPARIEQQHGPFYPMSTLDNPPERVWVEYLQRVYPGLGRPLTQVEAATLMPVLLGLADKLRPHLEKIAARHPEGYKIWHESSEEERQSFVRSAGLKILGNLLSGDVEGLEDMLHPGNKAYRAYFKEITGTTDPVEALRVRGFDVDKFRSDLAAFRKRAGEAREKAQAERRVQALRSRPLRYDNVVTGLTETGTVGQWLDHLLSHGWWELIPRKRGAITMYWLGPADWVLPGPRSSTSYELKRDEYDYVVSVLPQYKAAFVPAPPQKGTPPEDQDSEEADKPQWARDLGIAAAAVLTGRPAEAAPYVREARRQFNAGDYPAEWETSKVDALDDEIKNLETYTHIETYLEHNANPRKIGGFENWYDVFSVIYRAGPTPQLWGKGQVEWVDQVTNDLITAGLLYELCEALRGDGDSPWPSVAEWERRYPSPEEKAEADTTATEVRLDAVIALLSYMAPHLDKARFEKYKGVASLAQRAAERREAYRILVGMADNAFADMDARLTGTRSFRDPSYRALIAREVARELEDRFTRKALQALPWGSAEQAELIHRGFVLRRTGPQGGLMSHPVEPEQVGVNADQVAGIAKWVHYLQDQVNTVLEQAGESAYFQMTLPEDL